MLYTSRQPFEETYLTSPHPFPKRGDVTFNPWANLGIANWK
ncbi:hypothetical protein [Microcoleus sp. D2_18a_D3]